MKAKKAAVLFLALAMLAGVLAACDKTPEPDAGGELAADTNPTYIGSTGGVEYDEDALPPTEFQAARIEAEDADVTTLPAETYEQASGGKATKPMSGSITFKVHSPESTPAVLTVGYSCLEKDGRGRFIGVIVNSLQVDKLDVPFTGTGDAGFVGGEREFATSLVLGDNYITLTCLYGEVSFDYIELEKAETDPFDHTEIASLKVEAENAIVKTAEAETGGWSPLTASLQASDGWYVANMNVPDDGLSFVFNVAQAGEYRFTVAYMTDLPGSSQGVYVNGVRAETVVYSEQCGWGSYEAFNAKTVTVSIDLEEGHNFVALKKEKNFGLGEGGDGFVQIDYVQIEGEGLVSCNDAVIETEPEVDEDLLFKAESDKLARMGGSVYEAENAALEQCAAADFSGAGGGKVVNKLFLGSASVLFTIEEADASARYLALCYTNGSGKTAYADISYNGGAAFTAQLPAAESWNFLKVVYLEIPADVDVHTVRIGRGAGFFEADRIVLLDALRGDPAVQTESADKGAWLEADLAKLTDCAVRFHGNATFGGYVGDFDRATSALTFEGVTFAAQEVTLKIRYANPGKDASVRIEVNGTAKELTLPATGGYTAFAEAEIRLTGSVGTNTLKISNTDGVFTFDALQIA